MIALVLVVALCALLVGSLAYNLGRIKGAEEVSRVSRSDAEARALVEEVAGMTPAGRTEMVQLLLNHKPPLIDKETARKMLDLPYQPGAEPTREQCQSCLRDVAACSCPKRWTRGRR